MPEFPRAIAYIWRAYWRLRRRKTMGFSGPAPIEWPDIDAFLRASGFRVAPWELELLEAIDDLYLQAAFVSKKAAAAPKPPDVIETASMQDPRAVRSLLGSIGRRRLGNKKGEQPHG